MVRRKARIVPAAPSLTRAELRRQIKQAAGSDYPSIADEAVALVQGARQDHYGDPVKNLTNIGRVWAVLLDRHEAIPPHVVALMMAALKIVRESGPRRKRDNIVDAYGYLLMAEQATPHPDATPGDPAD